MTTRILAANAFWSLVSHVLSRGSQMLAVILIARGLDTAGFASFSYFQLTVSMLAAYAAMGMGVSASRFFAEVGIEGSKRSPPPLGTLWLLSLLVAVVAAVVLLVLPETWLSAGLAVPRWLLALGVFVMTLGVVPGGAILGLEKFRQAAGVSALSGVAILLGSWWAVTNHSVRDGMMALVLATLIQTAGESVLVLRVVGLRRLIGEARLRRNEVMRVIKFAGPMLVVSLVSASGTWLLGRMILHGPGGENAFALYAIGLQWFALALLLPGMLSRVALPRLVRSDVSTKMGARESRTLVRRGACLTTLAAVGVTAVGVVLGPWLLAIYGENYDVGRWFIAAFMAAAILSAPANMIGNAIVANDGQNQWLFLMVIWLASLLLAGLLSLSTGPWSGAVAQGSAAATLTLLALFTARQRRLI